MTWAFDVKSTNKHKANGDKIFTCLSSLELDADTGWSRIGICVFKKLAGRFGTGIKAWLTVSENMLVENCSFDHCRFAQRLSITNGVFEIREANEDSWGICGIEHADASPPTVVNQGMSVKNGLRRRTKGHHEKQSYSNRTVRMRMQVFQMTAGHLVSANLVARRSCVPVWAASRGRGIWKYHGTSRHPARMVTKKLLCSKLARAEWRDVLWPVNLNSNRVNNYYWKREKKEKVQQWGH